MMQKKVLALGFAATVVAATAVSLLGGSGSAFAVPLHQHVLDTPGATDLAVARGLCVADAHGQHDTAFHSFHSNVHMGVFISDQFPHTVTTTSC